MNRPRLTHHFALGMLLLAGLSVAGCHSKKHVPSVQQATVRFVHGSPDSGSVDFQVDSVTTATLSYGQLVRAPISSGTHNFTVLVGLTTYQISTNVAAGTVVSIALAGVVSLTGQPTRSTVTLLGFIDQPFNSVASGAAVSIHHASPFANMTAPGLGLASLEFGYSANGTATLNALGTATYGSAVSSVPPIALPAAALSTPTHSVSLLFYASAPHPVAATPTYTVLPSNIFPNDDANNILPFTPASFPKLTYPEQNLPLFAVDGPAASGSTTINACPTNLIPLTPTPVCLLGAFDPNGL